MAYEYCLGHLCPSKMTFMGRAVELDPGGENQMRDTVSIIVPTFNEVNNINPLVEGLDKSLPLDYEIIFVDDDSRDGTVETINSLAQRYPVRLISRKNKRGLASAVVDGISAASGDRIVVMDADLQHPPEVVIDLVLALASNDLVIGSRYCPGGSPGEWKLSRKIISAVANLLALPLIPRVKDRMSGFFAFRKEVVNPDKLNAVGWKIGLEIAIRGQYRSVGEVPFTFAHRLRNESKLSRRIIVQYLNQLFRLYSYKFKILNFMMVGGIGYVINMAAYSLMTLNIHAAQTDFLGQHFYLAPFVISSLLAIASNYILNKVWTFKGWAERSKGSLRYLALALGTLVLDMAFLSLLVDVVKLAPIPAAALAILIVFILRFALASKFIWSRKIPAGSTASGLQTTNNRAIAGNITADSTGKLGTLKDFNHDEALVGSQHSTGKLARR
jgi:dolichol-phosphate mannosyltransferase